MDQPFRSQFPSLQRKLNDHPLIFLDGPAGTQVPDKVINAMSDYYRTSNANTHGQFLTTRETDEVMDSTRRLAADFLGAEGPHTISFGQNMTSLNYALSRAIGRFLQPGDEILITQLDHEANRGPWLALRERGILVNEIRLKHDGTLNYEDLASKLSGRTRLVALGWASNLCGTINDIYKVRDLTHRAGAWMLVDAVHFAPHFTIDVQAAGCDFLLCSAYKFYGPHVGIHYSRPGLLDRLLTDRLRTAAQAAPYSIETGTLNHAAIAGVKAAIEFIAEQGAGETPRQRLVSAMEKIGEHERKMVEKLYKGLEKLEPVKIYGPDIRPGKRAPTISFTVEGKRPEEVCRFLGERGIFAWDGHFYAIRAVEVLGLLEKGGVTRMGISAYTTEQEIDAVLKAVKALIKA